MIFAFDDFALQRAQVRQEEDAVQVVDFVLHGARHQIFAAHFENLAFDVMGPHCDSLVTPDIFAKSGDTKAALLAGLLAFPEDDLRVD